MEYYNVHRHSRGSVSQFEGGVHIAGVKSVLFTSICGLKTLACRKGDVGYRWNFFAVATFVSLPALQGLHQPRKKSEVSLVKSHFNYIERLEKKKELLSFITQDFSQIQPSKKNPI